MRTKTPDYYDKSRIAGRPVPSTVGLVIDCGPDTGIIITGCGLLPSIKNQPYTLRDTVARRRTNSRGNFRGRTHVPGEKPAVFKHLFRHRYDAATSTFSPSTVTNGEIQDIIATLRADEGLTLSVGNPANFLKDFLRSWSRNALWPAEIAAARYTARQAYGSGAVFDFVPYLPGQTEPFPYEYDLPTSAPVHRIESVSLPSAARALGRGDESWLIQVAVHQRVLPTHFALYSDLDVVDLFHLQNTLKGAPEIDAVFLLTFRVNGTIKKALVTMEAKRNEPILPDQIRGQVASMARECRRRPGLSDIEFIVPVAAATRSPSHRLGIFEMRHISVADGAAAFDTNTAHALPLVTAKVVGYDFEPQVSGI